MSRKLLPYEFNKYTCPSMTINFIGYIYCEFSIGSAFVGPLNILMKPICFLVFGFFLHMLVACLAVEASNITSDEYALLALKSHITNSNPHILTNNWSTSASVCSWIGVTCGSRHHRVTELNLSYMGLEGTIPPDIGNLSFLALISIRNNSFYGPLPIEFASLRRLTYVDFEFNSFSGLISSCFGYLLGLHSLLLQGNQFNGTIPSSLLNLSSLQTIDLSYNELTGSIPFNFSDASSLRVIDLGFNRLSGTLPEDMFNHLPSLQQFSLAGNQLQGQIPGDLFKCRQLQVLSLSFNNFSGNVPTEIGNLTMLQKLSLARNNFEGSIPTNIGNCRLLKEIDLSENKLTGGIPLEIGNLSNLERLKLDNNYLFDVIPSTIFNISKMEAIMLRANRFSGSLPSTFGFFLPNLMRLLLSENKFEGVIPSSIANASKLVSLDLSDNSFSGVIPSALGSLVHLQELNLANNNLTSESSSPGSSSVFSLTKWKNLRKLILSGNPLDTLLSVPVITNVSASLQYFLANNCNIRGRIFGEIGNLSSLIALNLGNNELTGAIPDTIGRLQKLQGLDLQGNNLQGPISYNLCNLENLAYLSLGGNKLSGSVPECLGNLTSLRNLNISSNRLISGIPVTLWSLKDILSVNMSWNSLNDSLPEDIGNLKVVTQIDLSSNNLSGHIPESIAHLPNLVSLSLAKNELQGPIPESFNGSVSLEFLDLSFNNLSGEIPKSMQVLTYLKYFNVSYNGLRGEIPDQGPFTNFSPQSFMKNSGLCGAPRFEVTRCKMSNLPRSWKDVILLLSIILPAVAVLSIALSVKYIRRCSSKTEPDLGQFDWRIRRFSYQDLVQATDGFSESNLLGIGSFGRVYKGIDHYGLNFAVKVFDMELERGTRSFEAECQVMRWTCHRNVIKVISICSNFDFKALVLEYLPNGTLEKWLHTYNYNLDILQRLNLMIDVARALEYLHFHCAKPVIHCDLKPGNVLVDENMVARISDFGLAKSLCVGDFMQETTTLGTIGYIAPEYGSNGVVTTKTDVYSFGIMVMETFTGKRPTDEMFDGEIDLRWWVIESLSLDAIDKVADAHLLQVRDESFDTTKTCIKSILTLALSCSAKLPVDRFDMKKVSSVLERTKAAFLKDNEID